MSGRLFSVLHTFQNAGEDPGNGTPLNVAGLARLGIQVSYAALGSASLSPSASQSVSPSASASPSASQSQSPSASQSVSPSGSASPSASVSKSPSGSASPSASPSAAPSGAQGVVNFEATVDGTTWYELPCTPAIGGTAVVNASAAGLWLVSVAGLSLVRCRLSEVVTGAITVVGLGTAACT